MAHWRRYGRFGGAPLSDIHREIVLGVTSIISAIWSREISPNDIFSRHPRVSSGMRSYRSVVMCAIVTF